MTNTAMLSTNTGTGHITAAPLTQANRAKTINNFISYQLLEIFNWPFISFAELLYFHVVLQLVLHKTAVKAGNISQQLLLENLQMHMRENTAAAFIDSSPAMLESLYTEFQPLLITACNPINSKKYRWIKEWEQVCTAFINEGIFNMAGYEAVSNTVGKNIAFKEHQQTIVYYILARFHSSVHPSFI